MFEFNLYNFDSFEKFENLFLQNNKNKDIVFMCIGTKKYFNDSFGVLLGDCLKNIPVYVYGSSKREVNGLNYLNVYNFIKNKHKNSKIVVIDSVYVKSEKKPIIIYKNNASNVSGLNSNLLIGDESILFNSFSYSNLDYLNNMVTRLSNLIKKLI